MNTKIEDIDSCKKKIKFDIAFKDYQAKVQSSYLTLARQVKVPGFRPGKAPMSMLEKRFGPNVKKEVMTQLVSERLAEVIEEKGFRSVSPPKILEVEAEEGTDISVSASVEIVPDFKINDYSKVEIPIEITRVTDEDVNQAINYQRERQGTKVQVLDRPVEDKDFVKLDFNGTLNGEAFEGGKGSDHIVQIGSEYLLKDMGNQLIGMSVDEEKDIPVQIPENYSSNKSIAGKEVIFHVSLKGIQKNQLPELNDDFAKNIDPKTTPKTTSKFLPAPSTASESAKQLASFSRFIFLFRYASKSFFNGFPFSHIELAFLTNEESIDTAPGIPMPIDSTDPKLFSNSKTIDLIPSSVP